MSCSVECELCLTVICYVLFLVAFLVAAFVTLQCELYLAVLFVTCNMSSIVCVAVQCGLCLAVSFITVQYKYNLFRVVPFITERYGGGFAV